MTLARLAVVACLISKALAAQSPPKSDVNAANNPLTPKITINLHDQAAPLLYDLSPGSNAFLLRGLMPHKLGSIPQLFRFTMPLAVTSPDVTGRSITGVGDLNIFDLFPFVLKKAKMEIAVGPQFSFPTASETLTGTGKYQVGFATLAVAPRKWGLGGALVTWEHSFAGDSSRGTQQTLAMQPLIIFNLPQSWYLRSTATVNFDIAQGHYVIPLGVGVGKVWARSSGVTINAFAEPQFSMAHDGTGQPQFQVFSGLNLQLPMGKK